MVRDGEERTNEVQEFAGSRTKALVPKTHTLTYIITTSDNASVGASRVRLSVGTDDGERLRAPLGMRSPAVCH